MTVKQLGEVHLVVKLRIEDHENPNEAVPLIGTVDIASIRLGDASPADLNLLHMEAGWGDVDPNGLLIDGVERAVKDELERRASQREVKDNERES